MKSELVSLSIAGVYSDNQKTLFSLSDNRCLKIIHRPVEFNLITMIDAPCIGSNLQNCWASLALNTSIINVEQLNHDRIIRLELEKDKGLGFKEKLFLIFELTGYHNNIIITSAENKILSAYKYIPRQKSSYRQILNGLDYVLPPQIPGKDPHTIKDEEVIEMMESSSLSVFEFLSSSLRLKEETCIEIISRAGLTSSMKLNELNDENHDRLLNAFRNLKSIIDMGEESWVWGELNGNPALFPFEPQQSSVNVNFSSGNCFEVINQIEKAEKLEYIRTYDYQKIIKQAENIIKKLSGKVEEISTRLDLFSDWEKQKRIGDILMSYSNKVEKGADAVILPNPYDGGEIEVHLDPKLNPITNAQKYYRRSRKYKRGLPVLKARKKEIAGRLKDAETKLKAYYNEELTLEDLSKFINSFQLEGFTSKQAKDKLIRLPYREFKSSDGYKIWVGKSARDNDELTFKRSKPDDIWLHAESVQGSHVVIRVAKRATIPRRTIEEAACLAAYYSKSKHSSLVPVIWTKRKYVQNPRKSKPGLVRVLRHKTLMVKPRLINSSL
ncbi:NFACT family protein [bacterium]|nr:NFACT family protein [bacterium]